MRLKTTLEQWITQGEIDSAGSIQAAAVELSAEQYCSASLMLEKGGVEITHSYEIVEVE